MRARAGRRGVVVVVAPCRRPLPVGTLSFLARLLSLRRRALPRASHGSASGRAIKQASNQSINQPPPTVASSPPRLPPYERSGDDETAAESLAAQSRRRSATPNGTRHGHTKQSTPTRRCQPNPPNATLARSRALKSHLPDKANWVVNRSSVPLDTIGGISQSGSEGGYGSQGNYTPAFYCPANLPVPVIRTGEGMRTVGPWSYLRRQRATHAPAR